MKSTVSMLSAALLIPSSAVAGEVKFYVDDEAGWEAAVRGEDQIVRTLEMSKSRVRLAREVSGPLKDGEELGHTLTWLGSDTKLGFDARIRVLQSGSAWVIREGQPGAVATLCADALTMRATDKFRDDDWWIDFGSKIEINGFCVQYSGNQAQDDEALQIYDRNGNLMAELSGDDLPETEPSSIGVFSDISIGYAIFEESPDPDNVTIWKFDVAVSESRTHAGIYFVQETATVYLDSSDSSKQTNTLYRGQRVDVFEIVGDWARISRYYDGEVEGVKGRVARWLLVEHLTRNAPVIQEDPRKKLDPRIKGLPKPGQGVTRRDVYILYAAAQYYLETEQASKIEYGDKSLHKQGMYYLNFGGNTNHFFRPADIPDLEKRIEQVKRGK